MEVECALGRGLDLVEEKSVYKFIQSKRLGAAVALAFAGGQLAPLGWEGFSVLIFGIEEVALVEADAKAAFTVLVTAIGAAQAEADMVVDDSVINDGSLPVVMGVAVVAGAIRIGLGKAVRGVEPGGGCPGLHAWARYLLRRGKKPRGVRSHRARADPCGAANGREAVANQFTEGTGDCPSIHPTIQGSQ